MNTTGVCLQLCRNCQGLRHARAVRSISTTVPLHKFQNKYQYKMKPDIQYGGTYRLLKGASMNGKSYGPLIDMPDYTFLDGRPTPLNPDQVKERERRKLVTSRIMTSLSSLEKKKAYAKQKGIEDKEKQLKHEASKLIAKGHSRPKSENLIN